MASLGQDAVPLPRKRFVGRSNKESSEKPRQPIIGLASTSEPTDPLLLASIEHLLPKNYNFEIPKTITQIKKHNATRVALQMPEGLLMYACAIVDIIERFGGVECVIMGDVTYGACCIDDYTARALGCDMMVHYGHSCLIPVDTTTIKTLYVFVEISVDRAHLLATVQKNFPKCIPTPETRLVESSGKGKGPDVPIGIEQATQEEEKFRLALVGTIQFVAAVQGLRMDLEDAAEEASKRLAIEGPSSDSPQDESLTSNSFEVFVPQVKPLSPGEILGCTAPRLPSNTSALLYIGDGRFHLESVMIANPTVPAFRYDPYSKRLTREFYEHEEMRDIRGKAVIQARQSLATTGTQGKGEAWAVVLGTLGRQGNVRVLRSITKHLTPITPTTPSKNISTNRHATPFIPMLLSELSPAKLSLFTGVSTFVQTSCPRLSIDWGYAFPKPLLSPYEASLALGASGARPWSELGALDEFKEIAGAEKSDYPMDFYADASMGEWTPRNGMGVKPRRAEKGRPIPKSKRAVPVE